MRHPRWLGDPSGWVCGALGKRTGGYLISRHRGVARTVPRFEEARDRRTLEGHDRAGRVRLRAAARVDRPVFSSPRANLMRAYRSRAIPLAFVIAVGLIVSSTARAEDNVAEKVIELKK